VLLDGVPLADWDDTLRRQFALVSQDVVLFNDSVAANVALGQRDVDRARVRAALRGANLQDFVDGLPQGLDTPSATTAASCRAASASAWPSPARCTRTRRS
jgi:subfamily B ATP-binding cassette protein MsbA